MGPDDYIKAKTVVAFLIYGMIFAFASGCLCMYTWLQ